VPPHTSSCSPIPPFGRQRGVTYVTEDGETRRETQTIVRVDLDDFVACYRPDNRHRREATWSAENPAGRWRVFPYDELVARDRANLDITWIRDQSLADTAASEAGAGD
jgi:hypothetical protein